MRRRVTGEVSMPSGGGIGRAGALSPLNPKARVTSGLSTGTVIGQPAAGGTGASTSIGGSALGGAANGFQAQKGVSASRRTTIDLGKKV